MNIKRAMSQWRTAVHFGPYIDWQDWDIWHHSFKIGLSFGPWDFEVEIILWDIAETTQMLIDHGMTEEEAWDFCDGIRRKLPDPYDNRVNMRKLIEEELTKR